MTDPVASEALPWKMDSCSVHPGDAHRTCYKIRDSNGDVVSAKRIMQYITRLESERAPAAAAPVNPLTDWATLNATKPAAPAVGDGTDYEWEWQNAQRALDEVGAIRRKHPDGPEFSLAGRIHALTGTHPSMEAIKAITSKSQARRVVEGAEDERGTIERMAVAMAEAVIRDDEGRFPRLFDMLGYSGENKSWTVARGLAKAALVAMRGPAVADPPKDNNRCAICGWPLAATAKEGCVRGNCSFRPHEPLFPERFYDPERAKREAAMRGEKGAAGDPR